MTGTLLFCSNIPRPRQSSWEIPGIKFFFLSLEKARSELSRSLRNDNKFFVNKISTFKFFVMA